MLVPNTAAHDNSDEVIVAELNHVGVVVTAVLADEGLIAFPVLEKPDAIVRADLGDRSSVLDAGLYNVGYVANTRLTSCHYPYLSGVGVAWGWTH